MLSHLIKLFSGEMPILGPRRPDQQEPPWLSSEGQYPGTAENHLSVVPTDVRDQESECVLSLTATHENHKAEWELKTTRFGISKGRSSLSVTTPVATLANVIRENLKNGRNVPVFAYYPVARYVSGTAGLWEQEEFVFHQMIAYRGAISASGVDFKEFFRWFRYREDFENETRIKDPEYRDREMECIRNVIAHMVPGFSEPRVLRNPPRMVLTKRCRESESPRELLINQLSGGEKGLISLVADLARRLAIANPLLGDPLAGEGVILIDEIDLHLHPEWQREILRSLTKSFPNCQFFVATHSPQVISELETRSLYMLHQTGEGVDAEGPIDSYGRDSNQILEDLMGVSERPIRVQEELKKYFRFIDEGRNQEAQNIRKRLEKLIGPDDPQFAGADVLIRGREILGQ
jgi:predicted ATP-binding protein involved in virulence